MNDHEERSLEEMQRLVAANLIVNTLLFLRSKLPPAYWPFSDTFNGEDIDLQLYSNDGADSVRIWYEGAILRFANNNEEGYGGIAGIGQIQGTSEEEGTVRFIVLDDEGEKVYSPGKLRSFKDDGGSSEVVIEESNLGFFVYVGGNCWGMNDKTRLWDIAGHDIFTLEIQSLIIDLVNEGIFRM